MAQILIKSLVLLAVLSSLEGCASGQLTENTLEVGARIDDIYTRQTLINLSKFVDDEFAIPSQTLLSASQIQTTNTVQPTITFPLSSQVANTVAAAATSVTRTGATTIAGAGAGVQATNIQQQNFTVAPLNDAITLRNQQALYRHAVYGRSLFEYYQVPRLFFNNQFYLDPYFLQSPQCVLCAARQPYVFSVKEPVPRLAVSNRIPRTKWIFADNEASDRPDAIDLGHYGNHELFMRRTDYQNGALTELVLFTLSFVVPVETLTAPAGPQRPTQIEIISPTPPGGQPPQAPGREGELPAAPRGRVIVPAPSAPIPPATNQTMPPADRQNFQLTIPPSIQ
jgi:hypothetical protein